MRKGDGVVVNSIREVKSAIEDCPKYMRIKMFERERDEDRMKLLNNVD